MLNTCLSSDENITTYQKKKASGGNQAFQKNPARHSKHFTIQKAAWLRSAFFLRALVALFPPAGTQCRERRWCQGAGLPFRGAGAG